MDLADDVMEGLTNANESLLAAMRAIQLASEKLVAACADGGLVVTTWQEVDQRVFEKEAKEAEAELRVAKKEAREAKQEEEEAKKKLARMVDDANELSSDRSADEFGREKKKKTEKSDAQKTRTWTENALARAGASSKPTGGWVNREYRTKDMDTPRKKRAREDDASDEAAMDKAHDDYLNQAIGEWETREFGEEGVVEPRKKKQRRSCGSQMRIRSSDDDDNKQSLSIMSGLPASGNRP